MIAELLDTLHFGGAWRRLVDVTDSAAVERNVRQFMQQAEKSPGPRIFAIHGRDRKMLRRKREPTHFTYFDAGHLKDKDAAIFSELSPTIECEPWFLVYRLPGAQKSAEALASRFWIVIDGRGEAERGRLFAQLSKELQRHISMIGSATQIKPKLGRVDIRHFARQSAEVTLHTECRGHLRQVKDGKGPLVDLCQLSQLWDRRLIRALLPT